jgi:hypothetical protein
MLWLKTCRPEVAEEDPSAQERMTKGNVVGDLAMGLHLFKKFVKRIFHMSIRTLLISRKWDLAKKLFEYFLSLIIE